jgi:hypothetical protein
MQRTLIEELRWIEASLRLDLIPPDEVVDWATERVASTDSPGLALLAGMHKPVRRDDVISVLRDIAGEEHLAWPSDLEAGLTVAKHIARRVVDGNLEPIDGARIIWWKVSTRTPELRERLIQFVGLASEWEDSPAHRVEYDQDIREASVNLLRSAES